MTTLQVFVFDKAYHLVLRYSVLVHLESVQSVHPRVHFFLVYFFVSCFPTMSFNRNKLKYGTMKLNTYEQIIWMFELGAIVHSECTLGCSSGGAITV